MQNISNLPNFNSTLQINKPSTQTVNKLRRLFNEQAKNNTLVQLLNKATSGST